MTNRDLANERTPEAEATGAKEIGQGSEKNIATNGGGVQSNGIKAAALAYAAQGLPVFPCRNVPSDESRHKTPLTAHGFKDATTDPAQIESWWTLWPDALIGIPTGEKFSVLDLDKKKGKNGFIHVPDWESRSCVISRTGSGGAQLFFDPKGSPKCTSDQIALGVDTRGDGGYVIVPPSNGYCWHTGDILNDLAKLPPWPDDLRPASSEKRRHELPPELRALALPDVGKGVSTDPADRPDPASPERIYAALKVVSPDCDRGTWIAIGCGLYKDLGHARGLAAWDWWSQRGEKYPDESEISKQWNSIVKADGYGWSISTLFHHANAADPNWWKAVVPSTADQGSRAQSSSQLSASYESIRASDVRPRAKHWLWLGHLLRGSLSLLTGMKGGGKSQAQCSFVACTTTNKPWPDGSYSGPPMNAIMLTAEDTLDQELVPRLIAAGADLSRVHILKRIKRDKKNRMFLLSEDLEILEQMINDVGNVGVVTIDPITAYMGKIDSHKATDVRGQLGPLAEMSERALVAFSAITHPPKASSQRAIDHYVGSQAFITAARIGDMCITELDDDDKPTGRILFTNVANNPAPLQPTLAYRIQSVIVGKDSETGDNISAPYLVWEKGTVNITADQAVAKAAHSAKRGRPGRGNEAEEFLTSILTKGPKPANDVEAEAKDYGLTKDQVRRARERLTKDGKIKISKAGNDGPWMWNLFFTE